MGIEYPMLAILASMLLASMLIGIVVVYVYLIGSLARIPMLAGHGDIRVLFNTSQVNIKIYHQRGEPVELRGFQIRTDQGTINCMGTNCTWRFNGTVRVTTSGLVDGGYIMPGSTVLITIAITTSQSVFADGNTTYPAIFFFDKGILVLYVPVVYKVASS